MGTDEARATLAAIPALAGYDGPLERLGGMTNLVFRAGDICLRIPGKGTEEYINRANEAVAAREAAKAGVSPEVLHVDPATGVLASRFVAGAVTMSPQKFKLRAGSPARAGEAFRKLHASGAVFPFRFELFAMIDDYLKVLSTKHVALPTGYHDVVRESDTVRAALAAHPLPDEGRIGETTARRAHGAVADRGVDRPHVVPEEGEERVRVLVRRQARVRGIAVGRRVAAELEPAVRRDRDRVVADAVDHDAEPEGRGRDAVIARERGEPAGDVVAAVLHDAAHGRVGEGAVREAGGHEDGERKDTDETHHAAVRNMRAGRPVKKNPHLLRGLP